MDFDFDFLKTNLIFMQKGLKNMDPKSHEYQVITGIFSNEIIEKVRIALKNDKKAKEIILKIIGNNSTYFDKYTNLAFQDFCRDDDDFGPRRKPTLDDDDGLRYSSSLYTEYLEYTRNYDKTMAKLKAKVESIKQEPVDTRFFKRKKSELAKMEKLKKADQDIHEARAKHKVWMEVAKEEEEFNKLWVKDGEIVNINEECEIQLKQLSVPYFHKFVAECLRNNPELVRYRFDGMPKNLIENWCPINNAYRKSTVYKDVPDMIQEIIKEEQIAFIDEVHNANATQKAEEATKNASKAPKEDTLEID